MANFRESAKSLVAPAESGSGQLYLNAATGKECGRHCRAHTAGEATLQNNQYTYVNLNTVAPVSDDESNINFAPPVPHTPSTDTPASVTCFYAYYLLGNHGKGEALNSTCRRG